MKLGGIDRMRINDRGMNYLDSQLEHHCDIGEFEKASEVVDIIYQQVFGVYARLCEQIRIVRMDRRSGNKREKLDLLNRMSSLKVRIGETLVRYCDLGEQISAFSNTQKNDKEEA